jgi:hypothetical protein
MWPVTGRARGVAEGKEEGVGNGGKVGKAVAVGAMEGGTVGAGEEAGLAKPGKLQARAATTKVVTTNKEIRVPTLFLIL